MSTMTFARFTEPLPTTGRLGVVTLWTVWLTAPVAVLSGYTGIAGIWLLFFALLFGASIWIARSKNERGAGNLPRPRASQLARFAPLLVIATTAIGYVVSVSFAVPIANVVAAAISLGFVLVIVPSVAATPPRTDRRE